MESDYSISQICGITGVGVIDIEGKYGRWLEKCMPVKMFHTENTCQ